MHLLYYLTKQIWKTMKICLSSVGILLEDTAYVTSRIRYETQFPTLNVYWPIFLKCTAYFTSWNRHETQWQYLKRPLTHILERYCLFYFMWWVWNIMTIFITCILSYFSGGFISENRFLPIILHGSYLIPIYWGRKIPIMKYMICRKTCYD
jgi:hypothetical protein